MMDRYNREVNKLIISLGKNSILSVNDLKFIIDGVTKLGINMIDLDLDGNIDELKLYDLIYYIKNECNIDYISIITDGKGISDKVSKLKSYGLTNIAIRLESLKQYKYKKLNHQININEVLETIDKCINIRLNTKIICTLINDFNIDEILDFIYLTRCLPVEVNFTELIPESSSINFFKRGYVNIQNLINNIEGLHEMNYVNQRYRYYSLNNAKGIISIDTHNDFNICRGCNEVILDENGYIKTCIHSNTGVDIKNYINKPLMFKEIVRQAIYTKDKNNIESGAYYG